MEEEKRKKEFEKRNNEIVYSKSIRAGRRIYYLDVKKSRNDDLFIAITESKKKVYGTEPNVRVSFEKHKVFLYKEDFQSFSNALEDVIEFIKKEKGDFMTREEYEEKMRQQREANNKDSKKDQKKVDDNEEEEEEKDDENKKSFFKFKF